MTRKGRVRRGKGCGDSVQELILWMGGIKVPSDDVKKLKTLLKPGGKKKKQLHVVLKVFKTQEVGL